MEEPSTRWKLAKEAELKAGTTREQHYLSLQGDYGKWLVASLLLVNGGGIIAFSRSGISLSTNIWLTLTILLLGLILALVSGFIAWMNWGYHAQLSQARNDRLAWKAYFPEFDSYDDYVTEHHSAEATEYIKDYSKWKSGIQRDIEWTFYGSLISGMLAAAAPALALVSFMRGMS